MWLFITEKLISITELCQCSREAYVNVCTCVRTCARAYLPTFRAPVCACTCVFQCVHVRVCVCERTSGCSSFHFSCMNCRMRWML